MKNLHPVFQQALKPFVPPDDAAFAAADLARVRERQRSDWFQRECDRIFRRDMDRQRFNDQQLFPEN